MQIKQQAKTKDEDIRLFNQLRIYTNEKKTGDV